MMFEQHVQGVLPVLESKLGDKPVAEVLQQHPPSPLVDRDWGRDQKRSVISAVIAWGRWCPGLP